MNNKRFSFFGVKTEVGRASWRVLFSQCRQWINSTIHSPHYSDTSHEATPVDVPFAQGHHVSPAFFPLDFQFYMYITQNADLWDMQSGFVLQPDYFAHLPGTNEPVHFLRSFFLPQYTLYLKAIRAHHPK